MNNRPSTTALVAAFATIYLVWGSTYLGIKVVVETMPPFLMAGARFLLAGGILWAVLAMRGRGRTTARQWRDNAMVGVFLLLGGNGLVAWAEQSIPSGIAALIVGASPVFMVLTEWAWPGGRRPTALAAVGLAVGFAGVVWLTAPWQAVATLPVGPTLAVLGACMSWSIGAIFSRHTRNGAEPLLASALQMVSGGIALLLTSLLLGEGRTFVWQQVSTASWFAWVYLVLIGSLVGFSTFVWLMKNSTPARVSTYAYVNPVVAVFLGWLLLDEPVAPRTLFAAAVIIAGVVIVTARPTRPA